MQNQVLDAIADRRSIRAYKACDVTKEQEDALVKAALEAPSARNAQPWHFTVTRDKALMSEISSDADKNLGGGHGDIFYDAPFAIFISCDSKWKWGMLDSGIAVQNIALAAHSMGLGSVILGLPNAAFLGGNKEKFEKALKFPANYEFAIAIAIGVPDTTKEAHPVHPGKVAYA